jgi:cold shock protein
LVFSAPGQKERRPVAQAKERGLQYMVLGTFKWFSAESGYGLISPEGGGKNLFVHRTSITDGGFESLNKGDKVTYEVTQCRKGMRATKVCKA